MAPRTATPDCPAQNNTASVLAYKLRDATAPITALRAAARRPTESSFSRLRWAEIGQHHRFGVRTGEMAWREDNRHEPSHTLLMKAPPRGRTTGQPELARLVAALEDLLYTALCPENRP
jgi:hypothetical protein